MSRVIRIPVGTRAPNPPADPPISDELECLVAHLASLRRDLPQLSPVTIREVLLRFESLIERQAARAREVQL